MHDDYLDTATDNETKLHGYEFDLKVRVVIPIEPSFAGYNSDPQSLAASGAEALRDDIAYHLSGIPGVAFSDVYVMQAHGIAIRESELV